jgi:hypothetical protein
LKGLEFCGDGRGPNDCSKGGEYGSL